MAENTNKTFTGATRYILDDELAKIVNISMALEMPLLLKGEPGTGKTYRSFVPVRHTDPTQRQPLWRFDP